MKRARPVFKEAALQGFVADLLRLCGARDLIWYHIPNEGRRAPRTGAFLKRMGMLPGAPDLAFVLPGGRAAFLELKTPTGVVSTEQLAFRERCAKTGIPYAIARTPEEAQAILTDWGAVITADARRAA
jgi:hypothetical protein